MLLKLLSDYLNQVEQAIVQPVGCVSDSVTHQFNDRGGALRRIVNFGFLTELIAANTHPTPTTPT